VGFFEELESTWLVVPNPGKISMCGNPWCVENVQINGTQECSGDDFDCYWRAQQNILQTLNRYGDNGCTVIVTGDYHMSDFRVSQLTFDSPIFDLSTTFVHHLLPLTKKKSAPAIFVSSSS
jgi:hypothetical protein